MPSVYELSLPLDEEAIRALRVGDTVFYSGILHTIRDMGHRRIIAMVDEGRKEEIPFKTMFNGVLWHCGPVVKYLEDEEKWVVKSAGSTTSSRFSELGKRLIEDLDLRLTIGKGTMTKMVYDAMKKTGSCYLNTTGGCAAMYAQQIEAVENVYWTDLGLPEACWTLRVKDFGPLMVSIDSTGDSLYDRLQVDLKKNLEELYQEHGLKDKYAFWPKRVASGVSIEH